MTDRFDAYRQKHGDHFELATIDDTSVDWTVFGPGTLLVINGQNATLIQWDDELRVLEYVSADAQGSTP